MLLLKVKNWEKKRNDISRWKWFENLCCFFHSKYHKTQDTVYKWLFHLLCIGKIIIIEKYNILLTSSWHSSGKLNCCKSTYIFLFHPLCSICKLKGENIWHFHYYFLPLHLPLSMVHNFAFRFTKFTLSLSIWPTLVHFPRALDEQIYQIHQWNVNVIINEFPFLNLLPRVTFAIWHLINCDRLNSLFRWICLSICKFTWLANCLLFHWHWSTWLHASCFSATSKSNSHCTLFPFPPPSPRSFFV